MNQPIPDWIDRAAALALLKVKPQTLYAYASRGRIAVQPHPADPRASLYRAADVAALAGRKARGRKPTTIARSSLSWGEPSIETALSTVARGRLIYAGADAVELSRTATLEQVAARLWGSGAPVRITVPEQRAATPFAALAALLPDAPASYGRSAARLAGDAAQAIGTLAAACGVPSGTRPLHVALAQGWGVPHAADDLRAALVLMADHDLNASTFACRVAASTGAALPAALLAGLCALSGPVHGGASAALGRLIARCGEGEPRATIRAWMDAHGQLPGFGHPLYPEGDVRAKTLLAREAADEAMAALAALVLEETGHHPNIDFALTCLTRTLALPADAPFTLFLLGRSVGWAAHAIEQAGTRQLIRPRGIYTGAVGA